MCISTQERHPGHQMSKANFRRPRGIIALLNFSGERLAWARNSQIRWVGETDKRLTVRLVIDGDLADQFFHTAVDRRSVGSSLKLPVDTRW